MKPHESEPATPQSLAAALNTNVVEVLKGRKNFSDFSAEHERLMAFAQAEGIEKEVVALVTSPYAETGRFPRLVCRVIGHTGYQCRTCRGKGQVSGECCPGCHGGGNVRECRRCGEFRGLPSHLEQETVSEDPIRKLNRLTVGVMGILWAGGVVAYLRTGETTSFWRWFVVGLLAGFILQLAGVLIDEDEMV